MAENAISLQTTCKAEIWSGFYGIDEYGTQPECGNLITVEVEADSIETDEDGTMRPCFSVNCSKCGSELAWPHAWQPTREEGNDG